MKINNEGLALIKLSEGLRLKAYQDVVGVWTIGYGHTNSVAEGDVITKEQAEEFLRMDVRSAEFAVNTLVHAPLNENEFSALVSLTYNIGIGNLKASALVKLINYGDKKAAAEEFLRWNKAGGVVVKGLANRRQEERALFLRPVNVGDKAC